MPAIASYRRANHHNIWTLASEGKSAGNLGLGGHMLHWLWKHCPPDVDASAYRDEAFVQALCWFLIPEGLEEYIWNSIEVYVVPSNILEGISDVRVHF